MLRKLTFLALAALPLAGLADSRTLEIVESAYEAVLADVSFPGNAAGTLVVRMCASCDPIALQVSPSTAYINTNGRALALPDFLERVAELRQAAGANRTTGVGVFYTPDSTRVTRISLHLGAFGE